MNSCPRAFAAYTDFFVTGAYFNMPRADKAQAAYSFLLQHHTAAAQGMPSIPLSAERKT